MCCCGCGGRKNRKRRYAPGHDSRYGRRKKTRIIEEKLVPKVLQEQAQRDAQRGIVPGLGGRKEKR